MQFSGVLPPDAPNPRDAVADRVAELFFPVMGLVPQPAVEDRGMVGIKEVREAHGRSQITVSISYTLWRNPDDQDDPVNLADLDDTTRRALQEAPPWPRSAWLIEQVQQMRYPQLWEAVQTSWHREPSEFSTLSRQLVNHANYILMNQFREELDLESGPQTGAEWSVSESAVNPAATLDVNGISVPGVEIDTDPFVYAVGARLDESVVATIVVAREHLPHLRIALSTRAAPADRPSF